MFSKDYTLYGLENLAPENCDNYGGSDAKNIYIEHSPGVIFGDEAEGWKIINKESLYLTWGEDVALRLREMGCNAVSTGSVVMQMIDKKKEGDRLVYIPNHPDSNRHYYFPLLSINELFTIAKSYGIDSQPIVSSVDIHGQDIFKAYKNCQVMHSSRYGVDGIGHILKHNFLINNAKVVVLDDKNTFYYIAKHFGIECVVLTDKVEEVYETRLVKKGIEFIQQTINERLGVR